MRSNDDWLRIGAADIKVVSANDAASLDGTERVFSGYTGREVAMIAMTMSDGQRIELGPRFPSEKLRKHFVWLRSFRYFVRYYPPDSEVASVSLFNKAGTLLYRASADDGFLENPKPHANPNRGETLSGMHRRRDA